MPTSVCETYLMIAIPLATLSVTTASTKSTDAFTANLAHSITF